MRRLAFVVAIIASLIALAPPAAAAPTLTITSPDGSPISRAQVDSLVLFTADGVKPATQLSVFLVDSTTGQATLTEPFDVQVSASPLTNGTTVTGKFRVPDLQAGQYDVVSCVDCEIPPEGYTGAPILTVIPSLQANPSTAAPGATVSLTGRGWAVEAEPVSISADLDRASVPVDPATVQPSAEGTFTASLIVPTTTGQQVSVFACRPCTGPDPAVGERVTIRILQAPSIDPLSRPFHAGRNITVTGSNWLAGGDVSIVGSPPGTAGSGTVLGAAQPARDGSVTIDVRLPKDMADGDKLLYACQPCSTDAAFPAVPVTVRIVTAPKLTLAPAVGHLGSTVSLTGDGWIVEDGPVLLFASKADSADATASIATLVPVQDVPITSPLSIPTTLPLGPTTLYACQRCDRGKRAPQATAPLTVVGEPTLSATMDPPDDAITLRVTGTNWLPSDGPVSVYGSEVDVVSGATPLGVLVPTETFAIDGTATAGEPLDAGSNELYACQACAGTAISATATVDVVPPPPPKLPGRQGQAYVPPTPVPGSPPGWLFGALGVLLLMVAAGAATWLVRSQRAPRQHTTAKAVDGVTYTGVPGTPSTPRSSQQHGPPLPQLRIVPRPDHTTRPHLKEAPP